MTTFNRKYTIKTTDTGQHFITDRKGELEIGDISDIDLVMKELETVRALMKRYPITPLIDDEVFNPKGLSEEQKVEDIKNVIDCALARWGYRLVVSTSNGMPKAFLVLESDLPDGEGVELDSPYCCSI